MPTLASLVRPHVERELDAASTAEARGEFETAFGHLERAHVLSQVATYEHVRVHWQLLRFALRHDRTADAFGQLWRMVGAALLTAVGLVPDGNTGGSNVNGFRRMPIAEDLRQTLQEVRASRTESSWRAVPVDAAIASLTALGGCSTPPSNLDLSLDRPSSGGVYRVSLVPPVPAPAINQMHAWTVRLASADGAPVHGATFAVDGGMPQHGHGLPTKPRVTRELSEGTYLLEGMKFSMTGWWELKLAIDGPLGSDKITFNTVVAQP